MDAGSSVRTARHRGHLLAAAGCVAVAAIGTSASAQLSSLYVTALLDNQVPNGGIGVLRGGVNQFKFPTVQFEEFAIAVWGDVRTGAFRASANPPPDSGHLYDLNGTYLNQAFAPTVGLPADGTSDGQFNYCMVGGTFTRFDRQWQNPTPLFSSQTTRSFTRGVTFDPFDQSFWILSLQTTPTGFDAWVEQFTGTGQPMAAHRVFDNAPMSSFAPDHSALALDPADRTLWIVDQGFLAQVSRANGQVQDSFPQPYILVNPPGAEFNIPSPSTLGLLGLGWLGAWRRRRGIMG